MREALLGFIARLRETGVRISVAESLDAAEAMMAAGLERDPPARSAGRNTGQRGSRPAGLRSRIRSLFPCVASQPDRSQARAELARDGGSARPPVGWWYDSANSKAGPSAAVRAEERQAFVAIRYRRKVRRPATGGGRGRRAEGATARTSPVRTIRRAAPRQGIAQRKPNHSASIPISIMSRR